MLDHRAAALLVCATLCVVGLAGLAPLTQGFSQVNAKGVAGLLASAAIGAIALLGIAALLLFVLIIALVVAAFIAALTLRPRGA
jgi:hypothetical protein